MKILITILFCFILPISVLIKPIINMRKNKTGIKEFLKSNKIEILLFFVLIIGSLVRLVGIDKLPNAENVDELSSGYEAFSIMKYGIDRAGNKLPVFLYAWGSGQNALYSYIAIPFIALGGLNLYSLRLPMALIGIASLYVFYYLLKNIFDDKKLALIGTAFFAICPWHIMKSRWVLESNIFPDMVLLSVFLLVLGIKNKKNILQILSFVILGLSSYAYSTSYMFLPIYVLGILIYLIVKKEITVKKAILYLGIVFVVALPMILFVIINTFGLKQINWIFTIPTLKKVRYTEVSTIFQGNILENCAENFKELMKLLVVQHDYLPWNAIPLHGMFYLISIIFLVMGIILAIKKYRKNIFTQIINIWMIASLILGLFVEININRVNVIMIPCIYYIVLGIYFLMSQHKILKICITLIYAILFGFFIKDYCMMDSANQNTFASGMKEVVEYCRNADSDRVYCAIYNNEPFMYFLFHNEFDVNRYRETVQYRSEEGTFRNIKAFDKYNFYLPEEVEENSTVVVPKGIELEYNREIKDKITINNYDIYEY